MNKKILLFSGDPNSINSEIIYKSWKKLNNSVKKKIYIISNYNLIKDQFNRLKLKSNIIKVKDINDLPNSSKIKILNIDIKYKDSFKVSHINNSIFLKKALDYAHKLSLNSKISGFIN